MDNRPSNPTSADASAITLEDRLRTGEILVLDGGMGSELDRRGVDIFRGYLGEVSRDELGYEGDTMREEEIFSYLAESDPAEMRRVHEERLQLLGPWTAPANLEAPDVVRTISEDYLR